MVKKRKWIRRCVLAGSCLSLTLGVVATYAAYIQEDRFQHYEGSSPWIMGIAINSALAAVFILPLVAVIGTWIQRAVANRQTRATDSATPKESIDADQ